MFSTSVINTEIGDNIEQSLKFAQANNFDAIEIQAVWGKHIETVEKDDLNKLRELVNAYELKVSCISTTLFLRSYLGDCQRIAPEIKGLPAFAGNHDAHIKGLQQAILAAQILEAPSIRVFGFQKEAVLTEETFIQTAEKLQTPIELAKKAGITLAIENCPFSPFAWGINVVKLIQMIDSPAFRLLWDPANSVRAGEPDCLQAIEDIIPLVAHVHAKDVLMLPDGGRRYLPIGQGGVPWKTIFQKLISSNYDGAISLEPHFIDKNGSKTGAVKESLIAMKSVLS